MAVAEREVAEGVTEKYEPMSEGLLRLCLVGRQRLLHRFDDAFQWLDSIGYDGCINPKACRDAAKTLTSFLWRPAPRIPHLLIPWEWLKKNIGDPALVYTVDLERGLCRTCYNMAAESHMGTRASTWDRLPSYFDLPEWSVLNPATSI